MYLATGGHLFKRVQGDSTFTTLLSETDVIDSLAVGRINTVAVDSFNRIYIGTHNIDTQNRLLISSDGGSSFTSYNIDSPIYDIDIDESSGKIYLTLGITGLLILSGN